MFEAIGRMGRTKVLSPLRWVSSSSSALVLGILVVAAANLTNHESEARVMATPEPDRDYVIPMTRRDLPTSTTRPRHERTHVASLTRIATPKPLPPPRAETIEPPPVTDQAPVGNPGEPSGTPAAGGNVVNPGAIALLVRPGEEQTQEPRTVDFGDVRILQSCRLAYPPLARRAQITGEVMVEVSCSSDGRVQEVRWVAGNELFQEAVMQCLRETRFAAQPIPFRFRQPFRFDLK